MRRFTVIVMIALAVAYIAGNAAFWEYAEADALDRISQIEKALDEAE